MKTIKSLLLVCALSISTFAFADPSETKFADMNSISEEIEMILQESHFILDEEVKVFAFFSISDDKKIQCISVASGDPDLDSFIERELKDRKLVGSYWKEGMIYELAVDYSDVLLIYSNQ